MNLDRFTEKAQEAVFQAQELTREYNHQSIEPLHLLAVLLQQEDGIVPSLVTKVAGGTQALYNEIKAELDKHPKVYGSNVQVGLSRPVSDVLSAAERYAKGMQD